MFEKQESEQENLKGMDEIFKRKLIKMKSWHEKLGRKRVKMKRIDENSTHDFVKLKMLQHKYQGFLRIFLIKISAK